MKQKNKQTLRVNKKQRCKATKKQTTSEAFEELYQRTDALHYQLNGVMDNIDSINKSFYRGSECIFKQGENFYTMLKAIWYRTRLICKLLGWSSIDGDDNSLNDDNNLTEQKMD
ncbi:MAG: hypothetical protein Ta2E_02950 [Mycoplasmoidaceae bacterium]|nr:MAG: hypothetical protein Ta2E_02950 [Mycoplasmoidaceae bacterium]